MAKKVTAKKHDSCFNCKLFVMPAADAILHMIALVESENSTTIEVSYPMILNMANTIDKVTLTHLPASILSDSKRVHLYKSAIMMQTDANKILQNEYFNVVAMLQFSASNEHLRKNTKASSMTEH